MTTINNPLLGSMPSLVNYLNNSGTGTGKATLSNTNPYASSGDTLNLSPEAKALLAKAKNPAGQTSSSQENSQNQAQAKAQDFLASLFDDNNIDISKASSETLSLFRGLAEIVNDMPSPTSNTSLDGNMKRASGGARQSVTLQEDGHTVSFVIKYEGGKPASMTVTNITGGSAETAIIKLGKDSSGKFSTVDVTSEINTYNRFGGKTSSTTKDALHFDLYASDSA